MKTVSVEVKSKSVVVGTVNVNVYETIDEAVAAVTPEKALAMINAQVKADTANAERAKHAPAKASMKRKMQLAYNLCTHEELEAVMTNYEGLQDLLKSKLPQVETQLKATATT
jgi:hypothetical protein